MTRSAWSGRRTKLSQMVKTTTASTRADDEEDEDDGKRSAGPAPRAEVSGAAMVLGEGGEAKGEERRRAVVEGEGGGEEGLGGERGVPELEEVEEGLAVREGDGRDPAEAGGLEEVGVLEVVVLGEEDGGGERVGPTRLLGCEGGGGVRREGVVVAELYVVAVEDDLVQVAAGGVVPEHGEGIHGDAA